ncbi:UNVERIFIED_CONTAM: hypothetical protein Cloal_0633 [Acetivibrio alkalicellulosi]
MNNSIDNILTGLFETGALKISSHDKPFWYTSGTIGPYYINTHFLYGNEEKAKDLLNFIDLEKEDKLTCPKNILEKTIDNYNSDLIYKGLVDEMCLFIKNNIDIDDVDCISGGERRDWFFSLIIAKILDKPHITIYKDLDCVMLYNDNTEKLDDLKGKKVLHIADLITEASSYERAWIPAVKDRGGEIKWSVVVVDRKQGGEELLRKFGVQSFSIIDIDITFFKKVLSKNIISQKQFEMLEKYLDDPKESMSNFLKENPQFLEDALNSNDRESQRAKICIEKNIYNLK